MSSLRRRFEPRTPARSSATPQLGRLVVGLVLILAFMYIAWHRANGPQAEQGPPSPPDSAAADANRPVRVKILSPEEQARFKAGPSEKGDADPADAVRPAGETPSVEAPPRDAERPKSDRTVTTTIKNQKIRDQNGKVVYHGTVDLQETLDRIARGERGSHGNDGSVFQNREKRLPKQPSGYYREWVHPTPKLRGPGPQRIVTGEEGEIYYTPDHYETFRRLDGAGEGE